MSDTGGGAEDKKLSVHSFWYEGHLVIEVAGLVTEETQHALAAALTHRTLETADHVTVDLRRVDFLDTSGLCLLVKVSKRLRSRKVPLAPRVLVTPDGQSERVLRAGTFDRILEIVHVLDG